MELAGLPPLYDDDDEVLSGEELSDDDPDVLSEEASDVLSELLSELLADEEELSETLEPDELVLPELKLYELPKPPELDEFDILDESDKSDDSDELFLLPELLQPLSIKADISTAKTADMGLILFFIVITPPVLKLITFLLFLPLCPLP